MPLAGTPKPMAPRSAFSAEARPIPATMPTTEKTKPMTAASPSTEVSTWRRVAPMARSRAISLARCATMIEKVL